MMGKNKFEVHISKNMAKIANFQPKIGQDATFAKLYLILLSFHFMTHFLL